MKHLLSFLCLFSAFTINAQRQRTKLAYTTAVNFSPLALLQTDNTIMLGAEHRLTKRWAVATDLGYSFTSYYYGKEIKNAKGFIIRPTVRYYGHSLRGYIQAQPFYKMVNYDMNDWLGKDCVNGVHSYEKLEDFRLRKNVYGINFVAGEVLPVSDKMFFDLYVGFGLRTRNHRILNRFNSCYDRTDDGFSISDNTWVPSLPIGIRVGYALR